MRRLSALASLAVALAGPAAAFDPKALAPDVAFVVTTGYWQLEDGPKSPHGQYRVVVTNSGWEHVGSTVQLQWLVEDFSARTIRVYAAADVKELGRGLSSVGQPTYDFKRRAFEISATPISAPLGKDDHYRLTPKSPGKYVLERV
jgi:hypothetical protein